MSTIEKIDEKSFIIKFYDEISKKSAVLTAIECLWTIKCTISDEDSSKILNISLKCSRNISNLWNIDANATFTLIKLDGAKGATGMRDTHFGVDNSTIFMDILLGYDEISKEYIKDDKICVECVVEIKSTAGIHYKMHNFDKMDENINNTALIVEGRKLYVSKQILAMASPSFHDLFYIDSAEFSADEFSIDDVDFDELEQFLQFIHHKTPNITAKNYETILKLADRFDVQSVKQECENYLLKEELHEEKKQEMMILSEKYSLSILQILAMASPVFNTMFFSDFKESTSDEITIEDVKYNEFDQFSRLIYGEQLDITSDNYNILLQLADQYDGKSIMKKCDKYLLTCPMHVVDKFVMDLCRCRKKRQERPKTLCRCGTKRRETERKPHFLPFLAVSCRFFRHLHRSIMAEKYNLSEVQASILESLTDNDMKEFRKCNNELGSASVRALCRRRAGEIG